MKLSRLFTLLVSVFVVGALALPATAGVETGVIAVNGGATVGNSIGGGPIPQNGECDPVGKGLNYPGLHGAFKNEDKLGVNQVNKEVYYRLRLTDVVAEITDTNNPAESGVYLGTLNVCGIVGPGPSGIGAACGSSSGHNGHGKLKITQQQGPGIREYTLQKVTWPPTVGGNLPTFGYITRTSPNKKTKYSAKGTFQALVNAVPDPAKLQQGNSCARAKVNPKDGGARFFTVNGTAVAEALGKPTGGKPRERKLTKATK